MHKFSVKPIVISPVPSMAADGVSRPVTAKRLKRLRVNWFALGSVFGLSLSFLVNYALSPHEYGATASSTTRSAAATVPAAAPAAQPAPQATPTTKPETHAQAPTLPPLPPIYPMKLALKVGKGDTLLDMLIANRVQPGEAHAVVDALKPTFNPGKLRVGQKISVTLDRHEKLGDRAAVKELAIKLPNLSTVELMRLQDGGFNVASSEQSSTAKTFRGYGKVRSSILQAGAEGGIPATAMQEIIRAFSYDVDFQREIHPGDTIEVLIDRAPAKAKGKKSSGYSTKGGTVRYAALTLKDGKHEIFRFKDANGNLAWFDGNGNSIKKSLLRTPVDAVRITSGFGLRTHPIMGYSKMHRGVDFGASMGTPIMAAGDGVVTFRGWKGGYGNFVTIKHNAKYETAYGHISRFAKIKVGDRVRQGQVIAYVGSTGMSTGPHLHYEVRENNTQVNPVAKQFNMATALSGKQLAAFKTAKQSALNELANLAKPKATVASN